MKMIGNENCFILRVCVENRSVLYSERAVVEEKKSGGTRTIT
jgi:hypothetical protein